MTAIQQQEQNGSRWFTWIEVAGGSHMIITSYQVTESEALEIQAQYYDEHLYDGYNTVSISVEENKQVLKDAVIFIKTTNPNLTQWNNYLNGLAWYDAAMVRWALFVLAKNLADRNDIVLSDVTETEVLAKLRTWIINSPARLIAKVFYGE